MFFTNYLDEQGRLIRLGAEIFRSEPIQDKNGRLVRFEKVRVNGQTDSHASSYLCARKQFKELGVTSGFDEKYDGLVEVED